MRKSLLRKITSVILSLIMVLGLSCTMPLTASAEGNEIIRDGFSVSYNITSEWENNQNIGISITNTGTQSIENWAFKYDASGEISGLWGGIINSSDETTYIIENAGYNMEIKPGQTIDFGYQLTGEALCAPSDFKLATKKVNIDSGYEISFNQTSGWGSDVVGEIIISNTSDAPIKTWELKFSGDFLISNIWNAKLLSYSDGNYIVKSDENSAIIQPGSSAAVGIQCQKIGDVVLNDVQLSHVIIGDGTDDPVIIDPEEDYETDTDDDGLPDFYENQIGTNLENPDTDGDGLTDFEEAAILGTDPLKTDTDDNGVSDPDEDPDEDGLTNRQELDLELDPLSPDTDYDGLNDGDEINIYGTDPLKYDTDGDEIGDGDEIIIGLDPNNTHTFDVHDSEYTFEQTISEDSGALYFVNSEESPYKLSIEITAAGNVEGNLSANESGYANAINNDAVLGMVPGLYYNESLKVDSVRLNFKIDEEYVPEGESVYSESIPELEGIKRLNIFKYFEDDNMLLPIETKYDIENNIIYTDVDELGTYCIMDIEKWLLSLGAEPEVQEEQVLLQSNSLIMSPQVEAESDSSYACGPTIIPSDNSIEVLERAYDESYSLSESQIAKSSSLVMSASSLSLSSAESITLNTAPADIVFILQATSDKYYERYYEKHKSDILAASKYIFETMPNARVAVIDFNESKSAYLLTDAGDQWAYSYEEIQQIVSKSIFTDNFVYCDRTKAFTLLLEESQYRTGASRFAFLMTCGAHYNSFFWFSSTHQSIYSSGKYNYSEISQIGFIYDDPAFEEKLIGWISEMNGLYLKTDTHCNEIIYKHIFDNAIGEIQEFNAITLTGLKKITLKTPLSSSSNTDTDSDGLNDWDEVDITSSLIQWNEDGTIVLPTLLECYNYKGEQKPYVSEGFCKYMLSHDSNPISYLRNLQIMPILSDPTSKDSDGDKFLDCIDFYSSYEALNASVYFNVSDPNPLKKEIVWEWPAISEYGIKTERLSASVYEIRKNKIGNFYAHGGIDIAPNNKDVTLNALTYYALSSYNGRIITMSYSDSRGNYIEIEHNINGIKYVSRYLHLAEFNEEIYNQFQTFAQSEISLYINAGTEIGIIGDTGYSFGRHLHFEINNTNNVKIDPILFNDSYNTNLIQTYKPEIIMFINVPKNLISTCSADVYNNPGKCNECTEYEKKFNDRYNLNRS